MFIIYIIMYPTDCFIANFYLHLARHNIDKKIFKINKIIYTIIILSKTFVNV